MKLIRIDNAWTNDGNCLNAVAVFSDGKSYRFIYDRRTAEIVKMARPDKPSKNRQHQTWNWGVCHKGNVYPARARVILENRGSVKASLLAATMNLREEQRQENAKMAEDFRIRRNASRIEENGAHARRIILTLFAALPIAKINNALAALMEPATGNSIKTEIIRYEKATRPDPAPGK